ILNAVNLLLGSRASADLIRTGADTAELEALFQIAPGSMIAQNMAAHGYAGTEGLLIRRVISRADSNRVYINGRLATIQILTSLTENLASIAGQHAHQGLLKEEQHLLILDQFGGLTPLREKVAKIYHEILPLLAKLHQLQELQGRQSQQTELLEFQQKEITQAAISPGEDKDLEQERIRLKNAEMLCQTAYNSIEVLYNAPGSVVERLVDVRKLLEKAGQIDPQIQSHAEGVADATFHIEDLVEALRNYLQAIQVDENRLEMVEERLDMLNRLKRKYGGSLDAVTATLETINAELAGIENLSENIAAVETELCRLQAELAKEAVALSQKRTDTAEIFSEKVVAELATLKMPQTQFQVLLRATPADERTDFHLITNRNVIHETGIDRATFLIAPNVGENLKPLASIASGGELSRVVLALKAILAETDSVETVVFDEVDAGISGGVAAVVGQKLSELARRHQVICITHLPQIARCGDHHFSIAKTVRSGRTRTTIRYLDAEERFKEIARMLGGEKITRAALDHAREMLEK
ncbi:MAG: DNA repair protein RecN, partial [Desulfobacterales bacterium]